MSGLLGYDLESVHRLRQFQAVDANEHRRGSVREVDQLTGDAPKSLLTVLDESSTMQASPAWMDSWQILGARIARTIASYVPGKFRKVVVAVTTPSREYAAVMAALGMVRISYRNRSLPEAEDNFHRLAALPPDTMVRAVMLGGGKVEVGPVAGADYRGNLRFGRKTLKPSHCADIAVAPWAQPSYREEKYDIDFDRDFICNMVPSAQPELFVTEGRTTCVVMGPTPELEEESTLLVARPGQGARPGPLHGILRPFGRYEAQGWQSVICGTQSFDWPLPAAEKGLRMLILDGAAAVNRWIGNTHDADIVLALVHRSDSSAAAAAETILNQRRSARLLNLRAISWTPPPATEAIAFGEPA